MRMRSSDISVEVTPSGCGGEQGYHPGRGQPLTVIGMVDYRCPQFRGGSDHHPLGATKRGKTTQEKGQKKEKIASETVNDRTTQKSPAISLCKRPNFCPPVILPPIPSDVSPHRNHRFFIRALTLNKLIQAFPALNIAFETIHPIHQIDIQWVAIVEMGKRLTFHCPRETGPRFMKAFLHSNL
jgi:hypothetical protein